MAQPGSDPELVVVANTLRSGHLIGRHKADPDDLICQAVGGALDDLDGLLAIGAIDAHGQPRRDTMTLQQRHQRFDPLLLVPGANNGIGLFPPDAGHVVQQPGLVLDNLQCIRTEGIHDALGHHRPDAFDQAGAKVLADTLGIRRQDRLPGSRRELPAVIGMAGPFAFEAQRFPDLHADEFPNHRDKVALAARQETRNRVAGLRIMKGDTLE
jgi:hypothetical protein